jgi:heme-binding NEAT domain protein
MLRVKSMWYGENDKVSVVKKEKKKDTRTTWFETSTATVPRQRRQKACWVF